LRSLQAVQAVDTTKKRLRGASCSSDTSSSQKHFAKQPCIPGEDKALLSFLQEREGPI
jgi:hypothetical protein